MSFTVVQEYFRKIVVLVPAVAGVLAIIGVAVAQANAQRETR